MIPPVALEVGGYHRNHRVGIIGISISSEYWQIELSYNFVSYKFVSCHKSNYLYKKNGKNTLHLWKNCDR